MSAQLIAAEILQRRKVLLWVGAGNSSSAGIPADTDTENGLAYRLALIHYNNDRGRLVARRTPRRARFSLGVLAMQTTTQVAKVLGPAVFRAPGDKRRFAQPIKHSEDPGQERFIEQAISSEVEQDFPAPGSIRTITLKNLDRYSHSNVAYANQSKNHCSFGYHGRPRSQIGNS